MAAGFTIVEIRNNIDSKNVSFIRIKIDDYKVTLTSLLSSLMNNAWISKFAQEYLKVSYEERLNQTIAKLKPKFRDFTNPRLKQDTGEKVVSESARLSVIDVFNYADIPLAELFKEKNDGNPGYDFYSENTALFYVLFGEAKYINNDNAYNSALKQIKEFRDNGKLIKDIANLDKFSNQQSLDKASKKECGFMAAFSCTNKSSDELIKLIQGRDEYKDLKNSEELILIAVEL